MYHTRRPQVCHVSKQPLLLRWPKPKSEKHMHTSISQLMRDEFSKHRCLGQEWRRLLEAAKRMVSRSFLCLGFVLSQSVMSAELSDVIRGGKVLCRMCMWRRMCVYVNVVACSELFCWTARIASSLLIIIIIIIIIIMLKSLLHSLRSLDCINTSTTTKHLHNVHV